MRIQDYQITSSVNPLTTTSRRAIASDTSFQNVLVQKQSELTEVDASAHFCEKLSDRFANPSQEETSSALANKIAEIQASIEQANAQSGYSATSSASRTDTSSQIVSPIYDHTEVYNEGSLCCNDELNAYFKEAAEQYNIDVKLLKSVAFIESSFRSDATSKCGAMGIMQLMPSAAEQYGADDPYNAKQNIMAGAKILSTFLKRYDGDVRLTLAAYNAGPGNVKKAGGVPTYAENYVNKVLKYYNL